MALEKIVCTSCGATDFNIKGNDLYTCNYCKTIYRYKSEVLTEIKPAKKKSCKACGSRKELFECDVCRDPICPYHFKRLYLKSFPDLDKRFGDKIYCPECWRRINKKYPFALKSKELKECENKIYKIKNTVSDNNAFLAIIAIACFLLTIIAVFSDHGFWGFFSRSPLISTLALLSYVFLIIFLIKTPFDRAIRKNLPITGGKIYCEIEDMKEKFIEEYGKDIKND